jgi:hypothetical protein
MPLGRSRKIRGGGTEIEWDTSASDLCWWCEFLGDNIDTINANTDTLIDASKEVGLEVSVEMTKFMKVYPHQNADQNRDIEIGYSSFEKVSECK